MRPLSLHVRSVTSLRDLTIDLSLVPPGLCAVVGEYGAGKTSLLECMMPAPVFLTMPTRQGALADNVTDRDGLIELHQEHEGVQYRHLITVDTGASVGSAASTKAFLYVDGAPVNDGKLGTYREQIQNRLPAQHLLLASVFAAQDGSGSFAQLDVHGRRKLFRAMLGLDAEQAMADRATTHRKHLDAVARDLTRDADRLEADKATAAILRASLAGADGHTAAMEDSARTATARNTAAITALAAARAELDTQTQAQEQLRQRLLDLQTASRNAGQAQADAEGKLREVQRILDQADQIQADAASYDTHKAARDAAAVVYEQASRELQHLGDTVDSRQATHTKALQLVTYTQGELDTATDAAGQLDALRADVAAGEALQGDMEALLTAERTAAGAVNQGPGTQAAQEQLHNAQRQHAFFEGSRDRAEQDAAQLDAVPCGGRTVTMGDEADRNYSGPGATVDCGTCQLLTTATAARDQLTGIREHLKQAAKDLAAADAIARRAERERVARADATKAVNDLERQLQRYAGAPAVLQLTSTAADKAGELRTRLDAAVTTADMAAKAVEEAQAQVPAARTAVEAATQDGKAHAQALRDLDGAPQRLQSLQSATARQPLLQQAVADHGAAQVKAEQQLAKLPQAGSTLHAIRRTLEARVGDQAAAAAAQIQHQQALQQQQGRLQRLIGQLEGLGDLPAREEALTAKRTAMATRRSGLVLLERAFGAEGIQALEIDAAGPGVSDLANGLLASVSAPYSVELITVREKTARRKRAEVFDAMVHNANSGATLELARMSGGERVLVEESIKLAIAVHVAQRTGQDLGTIWRDECDGALSDGAAKSYPAMLRAACDRGGFDRCFFITHRPAAAAQADSVLLVANGRATLMDPASYAAQSGV